ncbi:hypothetical protein DFH27DRAFT_200516 [Peziza echinospora]|nr:hypothetical protein DFH27DRAFT_200516 [Peziza echinospora]
MKASTIIFSALLAAGSAVAAISERAEAGDWDPTQGLTKEQLKLFNGIIAEDTPACVDRPGQREPARRGLHQLVQLHLHGQDLPQRRLRLLPQELPGQRDRHRVALQHGVPHVQHLREGHLPQARHIPRGDLPRQERRAGLAQAGRGRVHVLVRKEHPARHGHHVPHQVGRHPDRDPEVRGHRGAQGDPRATHVRSRLEHRHRQRRRQERLKDHHRQHRQADPRQRHRDRRQRNHQRNRRQRKRRLRACHRRVRLGHGRQRRSRRCPRLGLVESQFSVCDASSFFCSIDGVDFSQVIF